MYRSVSGRELIVYTDQFPDCTALNYITGIGVARGAVGAPAPPPPGGTKILLNNLKGQFVSAPQSRARVNFQDNFCRVGEIWSSLFSSFSLFCKRRLKKSSQPFDEKSASPEKILATPMIKGKVSSYV